MISRELGLLGVPDEASLEDSMEVVRIITTTDYVRVLLKTGISVVGHDAGEDTWGVLVSDLAFLVAETFAETHGMEEALNVIASTAVDGIDDPRGRDDGELD